MNIKPFDTKNLVWAVAGSLAIGLLSTALNKAVAEEVKPEVVNDYDIVFDWLVSNHQWYGINIASTQLNVVCSKNRTCEITDNGKATALPISIQIVSNGDYSRVKYLGVVD